MDMEEQQNGSSCGNLEWGVREKYTGNIKL